MAVVHYSFNIFIDIWIEVLAALPVIYATLDDVEHMGDNTGSNKQLSLGIIIDAPRVTKAVCNYLKPILYGMITPDSAVDIYSFSFQ